MAGNFESFCEGIGLFDSQSTSLKVKYHLAKGNPDSKPIQLDAACTAAELSLGAGRVDVTPLKSAAADQNWSKACVARPRCIIQPENAEDVSKAIKIITHFGIRFAIRSGGHSPNPGWSSVGEDGVLLDLQKLNQVNVSSDKSVASVGPGARWGDVYAQLDAHGVSVVGGRIPGVGVAGLMLGGGLSYFTAEYGTAADNVKNFEVVLADGTITDANADVNSDLFWALKGGGPNFGIVTRFDLYTIPVRDIWYQISAYPIEQVDLILETYAKWELNEGAVDTQCTIGLVISLDMIILGLVYAAPAERPSVFAPFYELEPLAVVVPPTNGTVSLLTAIMSSTGTGQPRAATSRVDAALYKEVHAFWRQEALEVRTATGANQTFTIQHIPRKVAEKGREKGGNPMNIPHETHSWWTTLIDWENAADDDVVRSVSIKTSKLWKKLGEARGLSLPYLFMNDASRDQNPIASYGPESVAKLKRVALKYDEKQVFQRLQNGGFLLSEL